MFHALTHPCACVPNMAGCKAGWLAMAVLAPYTQSTSADGLFFDPPEMAPLVNTEAGRNTIQLLR